MRSNSSVRDIMKGGQPWPLTRPQGCSAYSRRVLNEAFAAPKLAHTDSLPIFFCAASAWKSGDSSSSVLHKPSPALFSANHSSPHTALTACAFGMNRRMRICPPGTSLARITPFCGSCR